jgi:hypothetical protein
MPNDVRTVLDVQSMLSEERIDTWIFGGWAEELRGLAPPRRHADIDLLYRSGDFAPVDRLIRTTPLDEIVAKRLPHKRAFLVNGTMVELILVSSDNHGHHTNFWRRIRFSWPLDVFDTLDGTHVASATALNRYRCHYHRLRAAASD